MTNETGSIELGIRRTLNFRLGDCQKEITLRLDGLYRDGGRWKCQWALEEIHPEVGSIYGVDPLHALTNCVSFLAQLIADEGEKGRRVWWNDETDIGGLRSCARKRAR